MRKKLIAGFSLALAILILGSFGLTTASTANMLRETPRFYVFDIYLDYCGDYETGYSNLYDDIFGSMSGKRDYDIFYVHMPMEPCCIEIIIEDCCIMGDTMVLLLLPSKRHWMATSPDVIYVSGGPVPGGRVIKFVVAYTDCPGGFPAGYYWYFYTYAC